LRLRIELRAVGFASIALWALPIPVAATIVASWAYRDDPSLIFGLSNLTFFVLVFGAFFVVKAVPAALGATLRAIPRSSLEQDLPSAIVFRAAGIRIEPAEGEAYERRWPYFPAAQRTVRGLELVLQKEPMLVFAVPRSTLRPKEFAQLEAWLVEHGLLR